MTLTEALKARGYRHRKPAQGNLGREILNATGVVIGRITAGEGWTWIALGCPLANGKIDTQILARLNERAKGEQRV